MLTKWLSKAKDLFKPAREETAATTEAVQPGSPSESETTTTNQTIHTPSNTSKPTAVPPSEETPDGGSAAFSGPFRYKDGDFEFEMPLTEEERHVLQEAAAKYEEMKQRYESSDNAWERQLVEHYRAKQYWSLQIFYKDKAQEYYKQRNQNPEALDKAIQYCKKQIAYAPMAIHANRMDPQAKELPQHYGYKQLSIIYDKQGKHEEAIALCRQALEQGWKGDWEKRIQRYEQNRLKAASAK